MDGFVVLHDFLFALSSENFPLCVEHIQCIGLPPARLIAEVLIAAKYRPTRVDLLYELLAQLCPPEQVARALLAPHVDDVEFLTESHRVHLAFLCFQREFLTISQIADCCTALLATSGRFPTLAFIWFAPELEASHPALFEDMYRQFESVWEFEYNSGFLYDVYNHFARFRADDWRLLREHRVSAPAVVTGIIADDVDQLQALVAKGGFNMNQRIAGCAFQWRIFHRDYPTMVQLAAFHGAIRCFKYLLLNGSDLQLCDFVGRNAAAYAVAGGSTEIVRLLEERGCRLDGCLATATLFHRNEIVDWFVERDGSLLEKETILGQAVMAANYYAFRCCLERGVDVNGEDSDVSLHFSASWFLVTGPLCTFARVMTGVKCWKYCWAVTGLS
jgi:hypothetical protein